MTAPPPGMVLEIVRRALQEDVGRGDVTTESVLSADTRAAALIVARQAGIIAGLEVARLTFAELDPTTEFRFATADGDAVEQGATVAEVTGPARSLLTGERTALNFVQRMGGIATLTRRYVTAVEGTGACILDTRKTAPGLRYLDKWAVALGGGLNHRFGLFDAVLIKDNHLRLAGGVRAAMTAARARLAHEMKIQVEVENISQVREALESGADALLLDNMSVADLRAAVELAHGRALTEASGGVTLETVRRIAETGVDFISVGALTHSAPALDIALEIAD